MNYFFSIQNKELKCSLTIPRFRNHSKINKDYLLFSAKIDKDQWCINEIKNSSCNNFFFLKNQQLDNFQVFFLAKKKEIKKKFFNELLNFNFFTDTMPDFRSNLKVEIKESGFSSYQADYPFSLCVKKGSVLSPLSILLNKHADKNYIFFKNIFFKPIKVSFKIYFVDLEKKQILEIKEALTNQTNEIEVDPSLIKPNVYIFSDKYLGIPIYVSIKDGHISMEHTHPPHLYIWGDDKFQRVNELKNKINEIIIKKNN